MVHSGESFEVYGFKIEVHAGGRRVWPPSFKRFVTAGLENGDLSVRDVMKTCNVSQSLIYKWRSDVRRSKGCKTEFREERTFSEIVIQEDPIEPLASSEIVLRRDKLEITLPASYPVSDLVSVIQALS